MGISERFTPSTAAVLFAVAFVLVVAVAILADRQEPADRAQTDGQENPARRHEADGGQALVAPDEGKREEVSCVDPDAPGCRGEGYGTSSVASQKNPEEIREMEDIAADFEAEALDAVSRSARTSMVCRDPYAPDCRGEEDGSSSQPWPMLRQFKAEEKDAAEEVESREEAEARWREENVEGLREGEPVAEARADYYHALVSVAKAEHARAVSRTRAYAAAEEMHLAEYEAEYDDDVATSRWGAP